MWRKGHKGFDEHSVNPVAFFLKDIEELACGGAIEIAHQLLVQAVAVSVH